MFRFIKKLLLCLFILLILALVGVYFYLGSLVKWGVEKYVPPVTGTTVNVGSVDISLLKGTFGINNLVIGSPKGFEGKNILSVGKIAVKVDMKTITKPTIIIPSVVIDKAVATVEANSNGLNLVALKKNIEAFAAQGSNTQMKTEKTNQAKQEKKVIIDQLDFTNASLNMVLFGSQMTTPLPDIHRQGIGRNSSKTISQSIAEVLNAFTLDAVKNYTKAVEEAARNAAAKTAEATKNAVKAGTDGVKKGVAGLKNLF